MALERQDLPTSKPALPLEVNYEVKKSHRAKPSHSSGKRRENAFKEVLSWRTYANVLYLLLSFPLGILYFVMLIVGFLLGVTLVFIWIGIPILLGTVQLVAWFSALERGMAGRLVDWEMPPLPSSPTYSTQRSSSLQWARNYVAQLLFWKSLAYLLLKLLVGMVAFTLTVTLVSISAFLLLAPILNAVSNGYWFVRNVQLSSAQLLCLSVIGLGVTMLSARAINLMASAAAYMARFMLTDTSEDTQFQRLRVEALSLASSAANLHLTPPSTPRANPNANPNPNAYAILAKAVSSALPALGCAFILADSRFVGAVRSVRAAYGFSESDLITLLEAPETVQKLGGAYLTRIPLEATASTLGELMVVSSARLDRGALAFVQAVATQAALGLENARLIATVQDAAALEERHRLARELHDSVSQALYGIALGARTAKTQLGRDPAQVSAPLEYVLQLAEAAMLEMRALIFELRPEALELEGLVSALQKQAEALQQRYSLEVTTDLGSEPDLSLEVKQALLRIVQEAAHNTVKHAKASHLWFSLAQQNGSLTLEVTDNGMGFDSSQSFEGHLGQRTMRERAEAIGAGYTLETAPTRGTRIRVTVPLE
jgi:signal transduction histidine kinase